jgi:hypothetical protein
MFDPTPDNDGVGVREFAFVFASERQELSGRLPRPKLHRL